MTVSAWKNTKQVKAIVFRRQTVTSKLLLIYLELAIPQIWYKWGIKREAANKEDSTLVFSACNA